MKEYCDCHEKNTAAIKRLGDENDKMVIDEKSEHKSLQKQINSKISIQWLFVLVPLFIVWMSFQMAIFNALKNVETSIAVVETKMAALVQKDEHK